ncbi:hypothetical protein BGZ54_003688, partial [Gamsiella multidivaricata]
EHERDNAYLKLAASGAIFLYCHRSEDSSSRVRVAGPDFVLAVDMEATIVSQTPHKPLSADITYRGQYLRHDFLAPLPEPLKLGLGKFEIYKQQPPSLMIKADTGLGKTVYCEALVGANKDSKFVAVTCRRTLGDMLGERLNFENYQDIPKGMIACDRVAVQAESLYRLDTKFYSENMILILDEFSSLIKQMCSDMTRGNMHNLNLQIFERLIRKATRVICLDADLSDDEVAILKSLRSDVHVIYNTFQQQKDDKVMMYESKWQLIVEVLDLLQFNKRVYVSSTMSARCTEALHALCERAGFKGVCVTKNTSESDKRDIAKNINTIMADLDYFIHTPTISVGIDYNVKDHVDYVVGLFSTHSEVDVESCRQMMRRVRHVKSKTYLVHVDASVNNLPDTVQGVKDWICDQHGLVTGRVQGSPMLKLKLDNDDKLVLPNDLYHRMYCYVKAKKHLSLNGFRLRFIQQMTRAGCVVKGVGGSLPKNHPVRKALKQEIEVIAALTHQQIANVERWWLG